MLKDNEVWQVACMDNLEFMRGLPSGYCSLVMTSPPYLAQRLYGIGFNLDTVEKWCDWMIPRVKEMCRVTDGLVCINMSAPVKNHSYQPAPECLVADLVRHHGIVCASAPYSYFRFSIPGSGGEHYHRRDWEGVWCFTRPECLPLKWSANTATGHKPKWAPGGEMSNRLKDGERVGKFGRGGRVSLGRKKDGTPEPPRNSSIAEDVTVGTPAPDLFGEVEEAEAILHPLLEGGGRGKGIGRDPDGSRVRRLSKGSKPATNRKDNGDRKEEVYDPPVLANSGNVIREQYCAETVRQLLESFVSREVEFGDVIRCLVGGGAMGDSRLAHLSEAPFSEHLVSFFVKSYAKPGGIVLDPFLGSGSAGAVAVRLGRRFLGCDIRESQVAVSRVRIARETPDLFASAAGKEQP